ncbi:MAG: M24 family metallopeptidase, partial [Cellulosilyticaceae bacterium]
EGAMILFDLGAQYQYYNADISRTFPASGKYGDRQKVFYNMVLEAQRRVIAEVKPGVLLRELNEIVRAYYLEALGELGMAESMDDVSQYYYHGVSHFLGLDTHDVGSGAIPLEAGMVITVEPGIYIAEEAIGIRIEDDVVVTETGCEVLSSDIIKTVEEIEAFMHA